MRPVRMDIDRQPLSLRCAASSATRRPRSRPSRASRSAANRRKIRRGPGHVWLQGTASGAEGRRGFSMVAKGLADGRTGSGDPGDWNYWKREPLAYASGVLATLPPGIAAPICYGVDQDAGDRATIFLEAVPEKQSAWSFETYRRAADGLGRFNGAYLAGEPCPNFQWMLPGGSGTGSGTAAARSPDSAGGGGAHPRRLVERRNAGPHARALAPPRRPDRRLALAADMPLPPRRVSPQLDRSRGQWRGPRRRRDRLVDARPRPGG